MVSSFCKAIFYNFILKTTRLIVEWGSYLAKQWLLFNLRAPLHSKSMQCKTLSILVYRQVLYLLTLQSFVCSLKLPSLGRKVLSTLQSSGWLWLAFGSFSRLPASGSEKAFKRHSINYYYNGSQMLKESEGKLSYNFRCYKTFLEEI